MTWRRMGALGLFIIAAAAGAATLLRRRTKDSPALDVPASDYEVHDGVIDLTGVATEDQVPDVIKGVVDVP